MCNSSSGILTSVWTAISRNFHVICRFRRRISVHKQAWAAISRNFLGIFRFRRRILVLNGRRFDVIFTVFFVFVEGDREVKGYVWAGVIHGQVFHGWKFQLGTIGAFFKTVQIGLKMSTAAWVLDDDPIWRLFFTNPNIWRISWA